jgi:hypothetical protein
MKSSTDTYLKIAIGLLIIVLILFGIILWRQYSHGRGAHMPSFLTTLNLRRHSGPLPVSSATSIQSWMTFDYVNYLFALPPNYLQTALGITAATYPRLSIDHYAVLSNTTADNALANVKRAIENYNATSSPE